MSNLGPQFTVHTQHGEGRSVRRKKFPDYDSAYEYAKSINPDTDSSMVPNIDEKFGHRPDYEKGMFWFGNRYAAITRKP